MSSMQMEPESQSEPDYSYAYDKVSAEEVASESYAAELAEPLAAGMMEAAVDGIPVMEAIALPVPLSRLSDVEADVDQFADQYRYCSAHNFPMPCLEGGENEPLPLDLTGVVRSAFGPAVPQPPDITRSMLALLPEQVSHIARSSNLWYSEYSPDEAKQFFGRRLFRFLIPRLQATSPVSSRTAQGYGLRFRVFTRMSGLRVHYSPAYWFTPNQVFGSPTSPVEGWIMPGRYKFGVVGGSVDLRFDSGEYRIPPTEEAHLEL